MLVLSRKVGHRILIAGNIEVTIVQIRGSSVRLGVSAPRQVSIERVDARKGGSGSATQTSPDDQELSVILHELPVGDLG
jgi:carbon storage regulator